MPLPAAGPEPEPAFVALCASWMALAGALRPSLLRCCASVPQATWNARQERIARQAARFRIPWDLLCLTKLPRVHADTRSVRRLSLAHTTALCSACAGSSTVRAAEGGVYRATLVDGRRRIVKGRRQRAGEFNRCESAHEQHLPTHSIALTRSSRDMRGQRSSRDRPPIAMRRSPPAPTPPYRLRL